jgi:hypothetical protein
MIKKTFIITLAFVSTLLFICFFIKQFKLVNFNQVQKNQNEDQNKQSVNDMEYAQDMKLLMRDSLFSFLPNKKQLSEEELAKVASYNKSFNSTVPFFNKILSKYKKPISEAQSQYYPVNEKLANDNSRYFIYGVFRASNISLVLAKDSSNRRGEFLLFTYEENTDEKDNAILFTLKPEVLKAFSSKTQLLVSDPYNIDTGRLFKDKFDLELSVFAVNSMETPKSYTYYIVCKHSDESIVISVKLTDKEIPDFVKFLNSPFVKNY